MTEQRVKEALREFAEYQVPGTIDVWPALHDKLNAQGVIRSPGSSLALKRLGWAVFALWTILLFVSAAYAFSPRIRNLLKMDPALDEVDSVGLGHPLNLTQTREGVSVTLDWAYADENRIAVAFTIRGGEADPYRPTTLALFDDVGTEFRPFVGMGSGNASEAGRLPDQGGYVFSFDASPISGQANSLNLRLEIVLESSRTRQPLPSFVFQFAVPFTSTIRVVEPKQTVTDAGVTITLEKVVVTPTDVTTIICFDEPVPGYVDWSPNSNIDVKSEKAFAHATVGQISRNDAGCVQSRYFPSLYESHGSWTLTVAELVGFRFPDNPMDEASAPPYFSCASPEYNQYCPEQLRIEGPWIFEFDLP